MKNLFLKSSRLSLVAGFVLFAAYTSFAQTNPPKKGDSSLLFPIKDRRGDWFTWKNKNTFDLSDTSFIKQTIEYDYKTKKYYIVEKIGNRTYRKPTYLTFQEFYKLKAKQQEADYFKLRADALNQLNKKADRPKPRVYDKLFDRTFGLGNVAPGADQALQNFKNQTNDLKDKTKNAKKGLGSIIDIRPTGNVDILMGYQGLYTANPTIPERARRTGGFDFDMNANVGMNANIGDKLKLPINYNTLANFDYLNQIKLDYKGTDDEVLKSIEAGNISFQSKGTLIPSAQNLFGLKTTLQFGKLFVTAALANQRSQRQNQTLQGGAAVTTFQKRLSDYEENRHFLLGQYFKNNYNTAMAKLPITTSQVQIQRIEVWVTNRNGSTTDARDVVAFMDLGENQPYNPNVTPLTTRNLPDNGNNNLFQRLIANPTTREPSRVNSNLLGLGLTPVNDYEKTFARKLNPNEYFFNPQVGFISLNTFLQPDEVLGVAYEYTYNGKVYKVGEFSQEIALDTARQNGGVQRMLFLKMLKATSARVQLPIWGLMMKNVYTLDIANITREGFMLNVVYEQPSGGMNRNLPESDVAAEGRPLIALLNLDRLNNRNDPQPDGQFDFVENFTIVPQFGRVMFPLLEPFGRDLERLAYNTPAMATIKNKYVFSQLYDSIKAIAQTFANVDRFFMQGQAKGTGGSDIYLGAFNIPQGSVRVNAGGQQLVEGVDYTIDYNLGSVKILNSAVLSSGIPVNVSYENNGLVGFQNRGFLGLRLDYLANKKLTLGATMERINERPFFTKMNIGDDPIRNTIYGVDFNYRSDLPKLTKWLDKLPFYSTKAMSNIVAYGEGAYFQPGHPPQIGRADAGLIYVDDFEGTRNSLDLRFPLVAWTLASTPQGNPKFPEALLRDSLAYNNNRAKLAWYQIEPNMQDRNASNNPLRRNLAELSDPRTRLVYTNELFPQLTTNITNTQTQTFDLSYYPTEPGPYNFETRPSQINANGRLTNPRNRWGGLMRNIDQTDFETNNFEFVEFWAQDPFIKNPTSTGGKLFLNLGNISEDILKDGKRFYENGLPTPSFPSVVDSSNTWGKVPVNPIQITSAFTNDPNDRPFQDVGFDGLDDNGERRKRANYITALANNFGAGSPIYQRRLIDPSNDNYRWFRDGSFTESDGILMRYKNFNNPSGNSAIAQTGSEFSPATTLYPDNEDLNRDNTLNETEEYYEYEINLAPGMDVGNTRYITDKRTVSVRYANGTSGNENWFLFRVPIREFTNKVGSIPDFKAIRFMRMYLSDFEDSVTLRFARLDLVRNQWRQFTYNLDTTGSYQIINTPNTSFNTLAVNLEENGSRQPVNYLIPPGIDRVQMLSNNGVNLLQNEQALSMRVRNLGGRDARGVIKNVSIDTRMFGKLSMFAHAESVPKFPAINDGDVNLVVRIGQDFLSNYYEIKLPLKVTLPGKYDNTDAGGRRTVWPEQNDLDFSLKTLIELKLARNNAGASVATIFRRLIGNKTFSILGNPNLGEVRGIFVGVENAKNFPVNAEVWINELRLSQINEEGGYAALGRVDVTLADLGKLSVSASGHTQGFGTLESKIQDRYRDNLMQFDAALNVEAGKLLPQKANLSIPVFASMSKTIRTPQFDPYDKDVLYKDKINAAPTKAKKDSIRDAAAEQTTIRTLNFTNVKVNPTSATPKLWSLSNFDFSFNYTQTINSSPTIQENKIDKYRGAVGYSFQKPSKYIEPFKKFIKSKTQWFNLVKDFNFNLVPSTISVRADINRQMGRFIPRIVNTDITSTKVQRVDTTYDKYFTFDRFYTMRWDLSRSLNLDFNATNNARVDEPFGAINTKAKKDSIRDNFFSGGRNTLYNQKAAASYTIPFSKFPLTDWVTGRYAYTTTYNWIGASLVARELGNTIENGQENNFTAQLDFTRLYQKSRFLRSVDNPAPKGTNVVTPNALGKPLPTKAEVVKGLEGKKRKEALAKWRKQKKDERYAKILQNQNRPMELNGITQAAGKFLTMLKTVQVNYSENFRSRIPGWMDSTQSLGNNFRSMQPGLGYVFGKQPDTAWLSQKSKQGLLSRDSTFNQFYRQNFEQKLTLTAQLEPIKELTIDLTLEKSFSKEYSQLFKDTIFNNQSNIKQHLNPFATGGFSVSYVAFNTLFGSVNPNEISETFKVFQNNRQIISNRLARENPYWAAQGSQVGADGYAVGYGRYNQDVLIPAFLAAYTKRDPNSISLIKQNNSNIRNNPFAGIIPRPNWRINYTGLSKIPALAAKFSNINISHGYQGNLSMNSYTSALQFADPFRAGFPQFVDTVSKNYVPFFLVPNITIQESFQPLIGIDITTTNQMNLKFEYKKSRTLSLSLVDYQLSETNATEWTIGGSFRKRGIKVPGFLKFLFKSTTQLQNDLNIKLDISMRDEATSNSRLDQPNAYGTGGQKVITIQPAIDYVLNNRINIKVFFDQRRVIPYIQTSAPNSNTRAGVQLRLSLQ